MWQTAVQYIREHFGSTAAAGANVAFGAVLLVGAAIAALLVHAGIVALLRRLMGDRQPYMRTVLSATRRPSTVSSAR